MNRDINVQRINQAIAKPSFHLTRTYYFGQWVIYITHYKNQTIIYYHYMHFAVHYIRRSRKKNSTLIIFLHVAVTDLLTSVFSTPLSGTTTVPFSVANIFGGSHVIYNYFDLLNRLN